MKRIQDTTPKNTTEDTELPMQREGYKHPKFVNTAKDVYESRGIHPPRPITVLEMDIRILRGLISTLSAMDNK
jgi:hypothetical protein